MKLFISGFLCCTILMTSTLVLADYTQTIQAIFGRVSLVVDGSPIAQETLLYDGTTYVPLRAAAEVLGLEVGWDGATNTASLTRPEDTSLVAKPQLNKDESLSTTSVFRKGELTDTTFSSEYMGLKFVLPEGFIMATQEDMDALMGFTYDLFDVDERIQQYSMASTVYEMMASDPTGTPNVRVSSEKLTFHNMTVEQYFEALKSHLRDMDDISYEFAEDLKTVNIAGQSFQQLTVVASFYGMVLTQDLIVRKYDDRIIGLSVTYTPDTLNKRDILMSAFSPY